MVKGSSSYGMKNTLPPNWDKQVYYKSHDDRVYDRPQSCHYQQKISLLAKLLETNKIERNQFVTKVIITIKIADGKDWFQVHTFHNIVITFLIWQFLHRLSQLKIKLACAMALSRPTKRGKNLLG